ncbi:MAG: GIY-YIG nuclease family protein [Minwuia sp.]|uniref:GIY-YIG nuclease family protein n=1 Tax=Minwuia sp. TaxID=2493630 RepID=UPI003A89673F
MRHRYFVYILSNNQHTVLYTGVTRDLRRRLTEHREGFSDFTSAYRVHKLVWFEKHRYVNDARQRERNIKHWSRAWKIDLVNSVNPAWRDLSNEIPFD